MRISDWSSDVCSSDLPFRMFLSEKLVARRRQIQVLAQGTPRIFGTEETATLQFGNDQINEILEPFGRYRRSDHQAVASSRHVPIPHLVGDLGSTALRSEEPTTEIPSLMRNSYAV